MDLKCNTYVRSIGFDCIPCSLYAWKGIISFVYSKFYCLYCSLIYTNLILHMILGDLKLLAPKGKPAPSVSVQPSFAKSTPPPLSEQKPSQQSDAALPSLLDTSPEPADEGFSHEGEDYDLILIMVL